ncbi:hypothetical protein [Streptomyces albireticuli]|uniref:Uncharacterized protein n=1 Tax=Streptomyces albireticuli TaxID=1940 RepID=A0A2A2DA51_9ACTN|nr:hypothetical protein [Streptomyces albireticuli]MCD9193392.1 hypothetical protein [Streptomyces albireticuli]PAU48395.1 hypothetical protein CK936_13460 [Streptomyces albireticuli]
MPRFPSPLSALSSYGATWSAKGRILAGALVLTVLLAVAGLAAWATGSSAPDHDGSTAISPSSASPSEAAPKPDPGSGSVPKPPQISDPLAYAKAAAVMLWSYDTRTTSREQQLAGMNAWMTKETKYTDWSSLSAQVPDPVLWSRMADNAQYATTKITDARYPSAFKQALADNPSAINEAYIYAVTVTGKQQITWKKGGGGAEDRSVTLAAQCRPSHDCSLVSIAPRVAP